MILANEMASLGGFGHWKNEVPDYGHKSVGYTRFWPFFLLSTSCCSILITRKIKIGCFKTPCLENVVVSKGSSKIVVFFCNTNTHDDVSYDGLGGGVDVLAFDFCFFHIL
ncbi:unnamed protein product [Pylaiella littoralis]